MKIKYTISMMVDGLPVRKVNHNGRTYLPVEAGKEFTILVENNTRERIAVVVSVDGLSVLDGKQASHESGGYVIEPNSYVEIDGWRRTDSEVAAFEVKGPGQSGYSEQMGHGTKNTGVIGCVIVPEKKKIKRPRTGMMRSKGPSGQSGGMRGQSLGFCDEIECEEYTSGGIVLSDAEPTSRRIVLNSPVNKSRQDASAGYGRQKESISKSVQFDRDESRKQVISLYYDTVDALAAKGVPVEVGPDPFPLSQRGSTVQNLLATKAN